MATIDSYNNVFEVLHINSGTHTGTVTPSNGVDTQGFESILFVIVSGTVTDGTWTPKLQASDSISSDFVDVTEVGTPHWLLGTPVPFTNADNNKVWRLGYVGNKRYVRCVVTETVAGTAEFGVIAELGHPHSAPTAANVS